MKTREVLPLVETGYWTLMNLLRCGELPPPPKDISGDFVWRPEDIARAREALAARQKRKQAAVEGRV